MFKFKKQNPVSEKISKFYTNLKLLLKGNPLKSAGLAGLILTLALAWALVFATVLRNQHIFPEKAGQDFLRDLRRYDAALVTEYPEQLAKRLDQLEKHAKGQDDWLSILKRRRNLSRTNPDYLAGYRKSAGEAARIFPHSDVMAAVAGESLIYGPFTRENAIQAEAYAGRISQQRFYPLALSLYVLSGALETPERAAGIPNISRVLSAEIPARLRDPLVMDGLLLGIIFNEQDSAIRISEIIRTNPNHDYIRLGAEYFYDY